MLLKGLDYFAVLEYLPFLSANSFIVWVARRTLLADSAVTFRPLTCVWLRLQEEAEAEETKTNGRGVKEEAAASGDEAAASVEDGRDETLAGRTDDAWEQMDDNFLLGDDQEEEATTEKRTVGVTE